MENIRLTFENAARREMEKMLTEAEKKGDLRGAKRIMAIFGVSEGLPCDINRFNARCYRKNGNPLD
jgi:hypothetical protein